MRKIKKGDNVIVMRGKDAGKQGEVLAMVEKVDKLGKNTVKLLVKGVNIVKKHQKPNPILNLPGGIVEFEKPLDISNVMVVDPKTGKATRVGIKLDSKTGKRIRFAKKSGQELK